MYIHVDVAMDRVPWANWLLITVTCAVSGIVGLQEMTYERQAERELTGLVSPDVERQLNDPRVSQQEKADLIRRTLERVAETRGRSPILTAGLRRSDFRWWQIVTNMFVHGGVFHILGNMLFLFAFGNAVNAKLGHLAYLGVYLLCGLFAGAAWLLLGPDVPVIGASGAIAGVTGVFLVLYPSNEVSVWTLRSMMLSGDAWRMPSWLFIIFHMVWDVFGTFLSMKVEGGGGVAYLCHAAGEALGVGLTLALVVGGVVVSERGELNILQLMGFAEPPGERRRKRRRRKPSST